MTPADPYGTLGADGIRAYAAAKAGIRTERVLSVTVFGAFYEVAPLRLANHTSIGFVETRHPLISFHAVHFAFRISFFNDLSFIVFLAALRKGDLELDPSAFTVAT